MLPVFSFKPIYKSVLWGGTRIADFKGVEPQGDHIGESWELSPMEGHESVVMDEGRYFGVKLTELVREHSNEIMGERLAKRFNNKFPLLIKFIDSNQDLSIQVHPDDSLAQKRHNSFGKTEMWYSIAPAKDAYLYAGFSQQMTPEKFRDMVRDNTIVDALGKFYTHKGDTFFLPAGRVHAIGKGNFVLEIQQASDITYRIFDYNRTDAQGNKRTLHVDESLDAINYNDSAQIVKRCYAAKGIKSEIEDCQYFTTSVVSVDSEYVLDLSARDSFTVLIATEGKMTIVDNQGNKSVFAQGQTCLIPSEMSSVKIEGNGEFLTVWIK